MIGSFLGTFLHSCCTGCSLAASVVRLLAGLHATRLKGAHTSPDLWVKLRTIALSGPRLHTILLTGRGHMSDFILARVREHIPKGLGGGTLVGICPNWRHVRYTGESKGRQAHHIDGREPANSHKLEKDGRYLQSRLTSMVYLNSRRDEFEGGCTTFLDDNMQPRKGGVYRPSTGGCIVFYQEKIRRGTSLLLYEGSVVTEGVKNMMRSVVHYALPDHDKCSWENECERLEEETLRQLDSKLAAEAQLPEDHPTSRRKRALREAARATAQSAVAAAARQPGNSR